MIKKVKGEYKVLSEKTGRSFGTYKTLAAAKKRLQQVEFFKYASHHPAVKKKLRKKF